MFFMLILVLSSNLLLMFVGWEGVGLCSYLLVGFYFTEDYATNAGEQSIHRKSHRRFRVFARHLSDVVITFKTLDFGKIAAAVGGMPVEATVGMLTAITLLLFVGATGKSAQIPLYVWLPDAMAGPTPVSALIHAATMVTAGVYMIARVSFLYDHAPHAMKVVAIVGLLTAVFAATIGITQNDIKKVFAYSTVSQLGYMFLGLGVGAYSAGIFHLMTHAFFKALLFLGAGASFTAWRRTGSAAHGRSAQSHADHLLHARHCQSRHLRRSPASPASSARTQSLSAAYVSRALDVLGWRDHGRHHRVLCLSRILPRFFGSYRGHHHPHESPAVMTLPLIALAILAAGGGFLSVP